MAYLTFVPHISPSKALLLTLSHCLPLFLSLGVHKRNLVSKRRCSSDHSTFVQTTQSGYILFPLLRMSFLITSFRWTTFILNILASPREAFVLREIRLAKAVTRDSERNRWPNCVTPGLRALWGWPQPLGSRLPFCRCLEKLGCRSGYGHPATYGLEALSFLLGKPFPSLKTKLISSYGNHSCWWQMLWFFTSQAPGKTVLPCHLCTLAKLHSLLGWMRCENKWHMSTPGGHFKS